MTDKENLFAEFPPVSKEEWLAKVKKDLKGRAVEELNWSINEDLTVSPFYHPEEMKTIRLPLLSGASNDWEIGEDILVDDLKKANKELLDALQNGVNAPRLILKETLEKGDLEVLFKDVDLRYISIHFKTNGFALSVLTCLYNFIVKHAYEPGAIRGTVNDGPHPIENVSALVTFAKNKLPNVRTLCVEIGDEGIERIPEKLAEALLKGKDYLAKLNASGISKEVIHQQIYFSTFVGTSYFPEIAKIRALKILWLNILEAYGFENTEMPFLDAYPTAKALVADPNTNMIKLTTQAMSTVLGGVDRLTVLPSDFPNKVSSAFAKRISRNVQHLLKMESFFDRVIDPSAGSYYIEKLTEKLAKSAWKKFQERVGSKVY